MDPSSPADGAAARAWVMVSERYDMAVLPGVVSPELLGFTTEDIRRTIAVEDVGTL